MARVAIGIVVGILLVFPGVEVLRFAAAELLGVYHDMTLTEAFLAMMTILISVIVFRGAAPGRPAETRGEPIILVPQPRRRPAKPTGPRRTVRRSEPGSTARTTTTRRRPSSGASGKQTTQRRAPKPGTTRTTRRRPR